MIIKAACTACTKPMIVEDYTLGQSVNCPYCGNIFVPPPPKGRAAPVAPVPGPPKSAMPIVSAKGPPASAPPRPAGVHVQPPPSSKHPMPGRTAPVGAPPMQAQVMQQPPSGTRLPPGSSTRLPPGSGTRLPPGSGTRLPPASGTRLPPASGVHPQAQPGMVHVPVVEAQAVAVPVQAVPTGKRKRFRGAGIDVGSGMLFGIGVIMLIFLACTPFLTWLKSSIVATSKSGQIEVFTGFNLAGNGNASTSREQVLAKTNRFTFTAGQPPEPDGMRMEAVLLMTLTLVIVLLGLVALLSQIYGPSDQPWPAQLFGAGLALVAAWSIVGFLWMISDIWKVSTSAAEISNLLKTNMRQPFDRPEDRGNEPVATTSVGIGLWLGLFASVVAVGAFTMVALRRKKLKWVLIASGVGVLLGVLIMFTVVQPTKSTGGFIGKPEEIVPEKGF